MTLQTCCPSCDLEFRPQDSVTGEPPTEGAVVVCLRCSEISVWGVGAGWVRPDPELRKVLLEMPEVVDMMVDTQMWQEMVARDHAALTALIGNGFTVGATIAEIVDAILADGFHRHPEEGQDT